MNARTGRYRAQSLAAWLIALRSGDPCPCCGAWLETNASSAAGDPESQEDLGRNIGGATLACAACGFAIYETSGGGQANRGSTLRAAA